MVSAKSLDKIIYYSFLIFLFLLPLVLTPFNYELFEFNKMVFTYLMTVIIVGAWLGKMIVKQKIEIKKTPLDPAIILYLISSILSTIFSIDPHTSIWGYYSRFHGGLLSTICYILLYYAFVSNIKGKRVLYTIYILLGSGFLVAFYGILERLGIDKNYWIQDVQNRVFSTLGQPNWLGAFINALIFIPLALTLNNKKKKTLFFLSLISYTSFFLCLVFTNSKSALLSFWLGLAFFSFLTIVSSTNKKTTVKHLALICLTTFLTYLFLGKNTYSYIKKASSWVKIFSNQPVASPTPIKTTAGRYQPFISESADIRKIVWQGAVKIWQNYPILGSGVETFAYSYYQFRPKEHNLLSEWDFLYNKAHNEFLNILSCQGTVGIISYLLLISIFFFWLVKKIFKSKDPYLLTAFFSGYLTILITNFFGFSVVVIGLFFFLIPALCFNLQEKTSQQALTIKLDRHLKNNSIKKPFLIGLFILIIFLSHSVFQLWRADYFFNQGEKYYQAGYLLNSFKSLQKAIDLKANEALYHNQLGRTAAKMALAYQQIDASQSGQLVEEMKTLAVQEAEKTLNLNPVHLNFYRLNAQIFLYLSTIEPAFKKEALQTLLKAGQLAPTDAKIFYNQGVLYLQLGEKDKAQKAWEKAVDLKANYYQVHLELAKLHLQLGEKDKAQKKLEFVLEKIDPQNKQAQKLLQELKNKN